MSGYTTGKHSPEYDYDDDYPRNDPPPEWESLQAAARRISVSVDFLRSEIKYGRLSGVKIGHGRGLIRVRRSDVDAMMEPIPAALRAARKKCPPSRR